jgi:uncharacterized protein (UPF0332 family)
VSLEEMLLRGELKREPPTAGEVERLLAAIERRLRDAANSTNSPETRLEQAYHAILNCALAALRHQGLRPTNVLGKHVVVLESLLSTLGVEPRRHDYYQALRDLRNREIYTGAVHVSDRDVAEAIEEAPWLRERKA